MPDDDPPEWINPYLLLGPILGLPLLIAQQRKEREKIPSVYDRILDEP